MTEALVLNELSYDSWSPSRIDGQNGINALAKVLRDVRMRSENAYLLSRERISNMVFCDGTPLRMFISIPGSRDAVLAIMSFADKAPFLLADCDSSDMECWCNGVAANGLLFCCVLNAVSVSFASDANWVSRYLSVKLHRLVEEEGEVGIEVVEQEVPNLASFEDVDAHRQLLISPGPVWKNSSELWESRACFSNLLFLPHVREHICALDSASEEFRQVGRRLAELQSAAREWRVDAEPFPRWLSHVTVEGERRKLLTKFKDSDGAEHYYDLHARFTPGAGRIHFRLIRGRKLIEIAYIGSKLV